MPRTTRSIASWIDTMTTAQKHDLAVVRKALERLLELHPELAKENPMRTLTGMLLPGGGSEKIINDLRHLARETYALDVLPQEEGKHYCERQKRPISSEDVTLQLHKKDCFVCGGTPEGRHGTRWADANTYVSI